MVLFSFFVLRVRFESIRALREGVRISNEAIGELALQERVQKYSRQRIPPHFDQKSTAIMIQNRIVNAVLIFVVFPSALAP